MSKVCTCVFCTEKRLGKSGIRTLWRKIMKGKEDRAPKVFTKEPEKYVCPGCLEETLVYHEEERLFICSNEHCRTEFALIKVSKEG